MIGKSKLVLDLSCRKPVQIEYFVVTDRWQKFTELFVNEETLRKFSGLLRGISGSRRGRGRFVQRH